MPSARTLTEMAIPTDRERKAVNLLEIVRLPK